MTHHILHYGYGYSRKLCVGLSAWFLTKYLPDYDTGLQIGHRGLKREFVYGWCDVQDDDSDPHEFLIEIQSNLDKKTYGITLCHELCHLKQYADRDLVTIDGLMYYKNERVTDYDYSEQPHEVHAKNHETLLYDEYLCDTHESGNWSGP